MFSFRTRDGPANASRLASGTTRTGRAARRSSAPLQAFEWAARADSRLNATARLAWLMTALSRRRGFANMSIRRMAEQLGASEATVKRSLARLIQLGLFERQQQGRSRRYAPFTRTDLARQMRTKSELNLPVRLLWLIIDAAAGGDGSARLSLAHFSDQLNAREENVCQAIRKLIDFDLVTKVAGGGRNNVTVYRPNAAMSFDQTKWNDGMAITPEGEPIESVNEDETYLEHFRRMRTKQ